jgi:UDP-GlcNAc3NAcA epimerase
MNKVKILTILGARPQFIKAGSVSRIIANCPEIDEVIVHTGQHYDANMSDIFFDEMNIPRPHYNLEVGNLSHGAMTGRMLEKIEDVLIQEDPDFVMVYGDTNSTLAGAVAAAKLHIKIAHVEAGLRSFNMNMPEEINRILVDRVSTLLFCPTDTAVNNLKNEGFDNFPCMVVKSGDVMQDGVQYYKKFAGKPASIPDIGDEYVLCTIHRAENTDEVNRLRSIFSALDEIARSQPVVFPMHPRTRNIINKTGIPVANGIHIIDPVGYLEMVYLIDNCKCVMTDSGGLQKEAYFFSKPCITLRDETEWIELVKNGYNVLVGAEKTRILQGFSRVEELNTKDYTVDFYGNGKASEKIVKVLSEYK